MQINEQSSLGFTLIYLLFLFGRAPHTPQQFFQPSLRTNAVSEAISKELQHTNKRLLRATPSQ
jgi:hypothetical protein